MKKILALLLAVVMICSVFAGCKKTETNPTDGNTNPTNAPTSAPTEGTETEPTDGLEIPAGYNEDSAEIYDEALGEFNALYTEAKSQEDLDARFAMMATAEAKLLESGVMLPLGTNGGNYAISSVLPKTISSTRWGNDEYRLYKVLVADKWITAEDRTELIALWSETKGTGTWVSSAKELLASKGYSLKDSYSKGYSSELETWDVLATSRQADSEPLVNTYDGLYEYDSEGTLQPALAESYTVSDDGLVYTFKIRPGQVWVDSQGRKVADVKADDFVAGMQHMMDTMGGLEYLVEGVIVNASQYINQDITDFSQVGVKAIDDTTLEYTLEAPCSYFMTMLGYGVFAPMSRDYYTSQGGKFGADFSAEDESYTYGKGPDSIAYCGPFLVTNATYENTIVFAQNESYWNKDAMNIKSMTWLYNDGSEATKAYNDLLAGTIDGAGLNASALEAAKADGNFDTYCYVSETDATSFMTFHNLNRYAYANSNDATVCVSAKTEEQKEAAKAAMLNVHFRRALVLAVDRANYNAQAVGEELKLNSLRNSYVPGDFVSLEKDTTIKINGTDTTFAAGTPYGVILQAQLDADGFPVKVWDEETQSGDSFDGWLDVEAAVAELNQAIEELAAQGIIVDETNPIVLDIPCFEASERWANQCNSYKQSLETNLGGKVVVNLPVCADGAQFQDAGYTTNYGFEANYDIYTLSGWGPDYGDPQTYLDTFLPEGAGYMAKCIGVY